MLGGLAPLPIRLGGSATEGVTAEQHSRFVADLAAVGRTSQLASLLVDIAGQTATNYLGKSVVGAAGAPTVAKTGTGVATVTWVATLEDEFEKVAGIRIQQAHADGVGSAAFDATYRITAPNQVTVYGWNSSGVATDGVVSLTVYGRSPWPHGGEIGDYGGSLDKINDANESQLTYAASWYDELTGALGTAYTLEKGTHVHARKLALARTLGSITRTHEKVAANSVPGTSDEKLAKWAESLGVNFTKNSDAWRVRIECKAKFQQVKGAIFTVLQDSLTELLGDRFVALHITESADLSTQLPTTYWPDVNPGTSLLDLGPGTWRSERAHLWVEVVQPSSISEPEFFRLMNVELPKLMHKSLPAWVTFNWATGASFVLDVDLLDFKALST